ncbi:MAG: hypothetical protein WB697_19390 [Stellaceae bacterium]
MSRVRAADDFDAIRLRLEELRREREQKFGGEPIVERPIREPDAVAHVPRHIVKRYFAENRRVSSR